MLKSEKDSSRWRHALLLQTLNKTTAGGKASSNNAPLQRIIKDSDKLKAARTTTKCGCLTGNSGLLC